ncbi:hypothetical protein KIPB_001742 [Kipferlia bialata]|uniref:Uncharacterized protein n=1 Tax=Kipferlia bialata TaxID=797122 RepID=A0A9K3CQS4_9EUKA|nr:hypothetical protein KIPB_001742 [Kipferlia bialata]|eukprot:g1742.t1
MSSLTTSSVAIRLEPHLVVLEAEVSEIEGDLQILQNMYAKYTRDCFKDGVRYLQSLKRDKVRSQNEIHHQIARVQQEIGQSEVLLSELHTNRHPTEVVTSSPILSRSTHSTPLPPPGMVSRVNRHTTHTHTHTHGAVGVNPVSQEERERERERVVERGLHLSPLSVPSPQPGDVATERVYGRERSRLSREGERDGSLGDGDGRGMDVGIGVSTPVYSPSVSRGVGERERERERDLDSRGRTQRRERERESGIVSSKYSGSPDDVQSGGAILVRDQLTGRVTSIFSPILAHRRNL